MRIRQLVAATSLGYAAYITYQCPCRRVNGCHLKEFFLSVGLGILVIVNDQRN